MAANGKDMVVKTILAAAGLVLTVVMTLWASGGKWAEHRVKLETVIEENKCQDTRIDYCDKEIGGLKQTDATLTANQDALFKALDRQDAKLDQILGRLPAGGSRATDHGPQP